MATVNNRRGIPQGLAINGVDAGGAMMARISAGYDNVMRSAPDGLQVPIRDRECQFVRGSISTQDWVEAINLLNGTVGTYVFYERKAGTAEASGFIKHTLTAPIIHRVSINIRKGGYATLDLDFECKPADETKTIADMWAMTDSQNAPTYITAARGGYRVTAAAHGAQSIKHVTSFNFTLALQLVKACNDGDVGYTCVDARLDGLSAAGSISFQDGAITSAKLVAQALVIAAKANLVLTVTQGQGATAKVIMIANVEFDNVDNTSDVNAEFTEYTAAFEVANVAGTPLTIAGTNKIITIADAT